LDGESAHDDTWSKTKGKWLGICGRAEKEGRNSFNARPAYGFEEMRPGPDDRCMPDFRKSHSRARLVRGAWPASPSIRSRSRTQLVQRRRTARVSLIRAHPQTLASASQATAARTECPLPRAPIKPPLPGRKLPHSRLTIIIPVPAACADRGGGRRGRAGRVGRLDAVTEESEHTAGRNGTGRRRPRAHYSSCHPTLSLPFPLHRPHLPIGARRPRNTMAAVRDHRTRAAAGRRAISTSTSL
jgi:hypothetical protein